MNRLEQWMCRVESSQVSLMNSLISINFWVTLVLPWSFVSQETWTMNVQISSPLSLTNSLLKIIFHKKLVYHFEEFHIQVDLNNEHSKSLTQSHQQMTILRPSWNYNSTDSKEFCALQDFSNECAESLTQCDHWVAYHSMTSPITRQSSECNFTDWKTSVSMKTCIMTMQSLFPSVTNNKLKVLCVECA